MKAAPSDKIRNAPLYTQTEAALYLTIPLSTLRYWAIGETRATREVTPLISTPDGSRRLSFFNLVELHVLNSLRREHEIVLPKIRKSLEFIRKELKSPRPLLDKNFETDGVDLFVDHYGKLIKVSSDSRQLMLKGLQLSLKRVKRDSKTIPFKLFPYTHSKPEDSPQYISMTPSLFSGRPVIDGTGLSTAVIADRYKAGDSISSLAEDYDQDISKIEEAIRCELKLAA